MSAYRFLLRFVPRSLREAHGDDMEEMFASELAGARRRGRVAMARVYLAAAFDVMARAPYEHWRRRYFHQVPNHRREQPMHSFFSDLRFAIRSFARQPGATALVVITLALAVGANTAVFALVDAVFFRLREDQALPKWPL